MTICTDDGYWFSFEPADGTGFGKLEVYLLQELIVTADCLSDEVGAEFCGIVDRHRRMTASQ